MYLEEKSHMFLCRHTPECEVGSFVGNFNIAYQSARLHISDYRHLYTLKYMYW